MDISNITFPHMVNFTYMENVKLKKTLYNYLMEMTHFPSKIAFLSEVKEKTKEILNLLKRLLM